MTGEYRQKFRIGFAAEALIKRWMIHREKTVLHLYREDSYPRLELPTGDVIVPDLLVLEEVSNVPGTFYFVEGKFKEACTWHRISGSWQVSISIRKFQHYECAEARTDLNVTVVFLIDRRRSSPEERDAGADEYSPSGLYGQTLRRLAGSIDHPAMNGNERAYYWRIESLSQWATIDELREFDDPATPVLRHEEYSNGNL